MLFSVKKPHAMQNALLALDKTKCIGLGVLGFFFLNVSEAFES